MSTATTPNAKAAEVLNHLLRGEIASVDTYEQTLSKLEQYPAAAQELRRIQDEHRDTVRVLKEHVTKLGGTPNETSGPWGTFTQVVTGAAKVIGPDTAIANLKNGEEYGIKDYQTCLENADLPAECKDLVRGKLLPRCQAHLGALDSVRGFIK